MESMASWVRGGESAGHGTIATELWRCTDTTRRFKVTLHVPDADTVRAQDAMTFDANASGTTALWNMQNIQGACGVMFAKKYATVRGIGEIALPEGGTPIIVFVNFFNDRRLPDGSPCSSKLGASVVSDNQYWRIPVHHGPLAAGREWLRYAHGAKVQSLYSILYHGRMQASQDPDLGDQLTGGMSGVGVFRWDAQKWRP